jgi:hypothetical protein
MSSVVKIKDKLNVCFRLSVLTQAHTNANVFESHFLFIYLEYKTLVHRYFTCIASDIWSLKYFNISKRLQIDVYEGSCRLYDSIFKF